MNSTTNQLMLTPMRMPKTRASCMFWRGRIFRW